MKSLPPLPAVARAVAAALAAAASAVALAGPLPSAIDPATGALNIGVDGPGTFNVKVEVTAGGRVTVIDNTGATPPRTFTGITAINYRSGAGDDFVEFDINSSQSLALSMSTGAGDAFVKLQWKVPPGAAATTSTLAMASGGGSVNVELDFESETPTSSFAWTTNFGGGEKSIKGAIEFKQGTVNASKNVNFANLGGGFHNITFEVENKARNANLLFDSGFARDVTYKLLSDDPTQSLVADTRVRGGKNNVEILSAATATTTRFSGGTAGTSGAETNYVVVQKAPGTVNATLNHTAFGATNSKLNAKFDGAQASLALAGTVTGSVAADAIKIESNMPTSSSLVVNTGGGDDSVDFIVANRLSGAPGLPRFLLGDGNDLFNLIADSASTGNPQIDCGAGTDIAKATVGTAVGCEQFGR